MSKVNLTKGVSLAKSVNLVKNVRGDHFVGSRDTNRRAAAQRKAFREFVNLHA